jgi:hypothetical protein
MTIKRCKHIIDINLPLLKKFLDVAEGKHFVYENISTHMTFKSSMSTSDKKELATWIMRDIAIQAAKDATEKVTGKKG